jgi:hypothetical protein
VLPADTFWRRDCSERSVMAVGAADVDGVTMEPLRRRIRGHPEPLVYPYAGHFVPEFGQEVASETLRLLGDI